MRAREFWQAHLTYIQDEGISTADYARREGLVVQRLYAWHNRLKSSDVQGAPLSQNHRIQRSRFMAVEIDTYSTKSAACTLTLGVTGFVRKKAFLPWLT